VSLSTKKPSSATQPKILLGVTGSVAAYKAASILKALRPHFDLRVGLTAAGSRLVRASELAKASGHPVGQDAFRGVKPIPVNTPSGSHPLIRVPHIEFARECDLVLIAPATADFLGKMALGLADDLLSSCCLYSTAPVMVAPAMNTHMWENPAVKHNLEILRSRGVTILEPASGHLACGDEGKGRLLDPASIVAAVERHFQNRNRWRGCSVLVTAGPTQESLDPVRVLTNHSSGKMGYALAAASRARGASTTLITGPTALTPPAGVATVPIRTAVEMHREVMRRFPKTDLFILAAAVADFRPAHQVRSKIKKGKGGLNLRLVQNPDILSDVIRHRGPSQRVVGFAAETDDLARRATAKWRRKPCDLLAANIVGKPGTGFNSEQNELLVFCRGEKKPVKLGRASKDRLAEQLLDLIDETAHT